MIVNGFLYFVDKPAPEPEPKRDGDGSGAVVASQQTQPVKTREER